MADKGGLQLLPDTRKKIEVKIPGENRLISIGVWLVIIVVAISGGMWLYANNVSGQVATADSQLSALENQRDKPSEQKLLTLSKEIGITNQILQNHIYWSAGFTKIENALQNNIQFKNFSAGVNDNTLSVHATADNYTTIARQIAALNADDAITDVSLSNVSALTTGQLDFNLKIIFDPSKFLKK